MHLLRVQIVSALTLLLTGCSHPHTAAKSFDEMSSQEQIAYCRAQAERAMMEGCTDAVPGIRAFVRILPDVTSDAIVKWRGQAEFDFVNHLGGIDRTNLHLVFLRINGGRMITIPDQDFYEREWKSKQQQILSGRN